MTSSTSTICLKTDAVILPERARVRSGGGRSSNGDEPKTARRAGFLIVWTTGLDAAAPDLGAFDEDRGGVTTVIQLIVERREHKLLQERRR